MSIEFHIFLLEIGEMIISAFIGLVGLGPASRVFTFHLLDSLLAVARVCPSAIWVLKISDIGKRVNKVLEEWIKAENKDGTETEVLAAVARVYPSAIWVLRIPDIGKRVHKVLIDEEWIKAENKDETEIEILAAIARVLIYEVIG